MPINPSRPNAYSNAILRPPAAAPAAAESAVATTAPPCPATANTNAIGTPSSTHTTVLGGGLQTQQERGRRRGAGDQRPETRPVELDGHGHSGSTTKVVPAAAARKPAGRSVGRCTVGRQGSAKPTEPGLLAGVSVTKVTNFCARVGCGAFFSTAIGRYSRRWGPRES